MITSTNNPKVKNIVNLLKKASARKEQGLFVVEGERIVKEIPTDRIVRLYFSSAFILGRKEGEEQIVRGVLSDPGVSALPPYEIVAEHVFAAMADTKTPQGVMAIVKIIDREFVPKVDRNSLFLVLEHIQDPGNLGTMLRTAEGAGVSGVILSSDTADLYNPKVVRSTMGSLFRVPFYYVKDLQKTLRDLRAAGVTVCAAHLAGERNFYEEDYTGPVAFVIGNEGNGLTGETSALADCKVRIPMEGRLESLNAGVSAALLLYEAVRQRTT